MSPRTKRPSSVKVGVSRPAADQLAVISLVISVLALAGSVPAVVLSLDQLSEERAQDRQRVQTEEVITRALELDSATELAKAAAGTSPGSAAEAYLRAVADVAELREAAGPLPALDLDSGCAASSVACGNVGGFSFDDNGAVEGFHVAGVSVSNLLIESSIASAADGVTATVLSGFVSDGQATMTIRIENPTNEAARLEQAMFRTSDTRVGVIDLDDEASIRGVQCNTDTTIATRSIGAVRCTITAYGSAGVLSLRLTGGASASREMWLPIL